MAAPRGSRRNLTYREKLAIVQKKEDEPGWTQRNLALWAKEVFHLESKPTQATISNLLRGKDKLLSAAVPPEFRSARRVKHPELDQAILRWVRAELQRGRLMTPTAVRSRALELARELQLPPDVSFSKGWVSSFMSRHQLNFPRKGGSALLPTAVGRPEQEQVQQVQEVQEVQQVQEETEEEETETDYAVEAEEEQVEQVQEDTEAEPSTAEDPTPRPSAKRRRVGHRDAGGGAWESAREEGRATGELLLDWIAVPGSYSRWWLLKSDEDKKPLCDEINLFLRSHGLRGMDSVDIRQQMTAFVTTFQAAHTWLRQTRVEYPMAVADMSLEQEGVKSHVLHMCPHYERLVAVLAAYVNYDDKAASAMQSAEAPATATIEATEPASIDAEPVTHARETSAAVDSPPKPTAKPRRQSTESKAAADSFDDETRAQKRRLFELECTRLQSEIETRNIQLVLEKTLARKKLLDAGISHEEVERIFPL
ncbi:hypothetical protein PHYPSEUDO_009535 [Phytophthora pseudosyringae]|uniref:HTH CENPB-type domain-containing protein n=1 Tax=Phytophthora pseudosyringae TaxID=221518 RepID=A0A8T1WJF9_9STRA|nr:hypothetical protein PHYPSEUDO_009535 [Phytophthora pseudosyringae]